MEITNQIPANARSTQDIKADLRSGQVVSANVKERISDKEAILTIRGQEVRASFEGKMPEGDRVLVEIRGTEGQTITVKAVDDQALRTMATSNKGIADRDIQQIAQKFGLKVTPELKEALRMIIDAGIPLSKDVISEVKGFLDRQWDQNYDNTNRAQQLNLISNKLDTLQTVVSKNIGLSQIHLQAVHEVLHDSNMADSLKTLQNEFAMLQSGNLASQQSYMNNELIQTLGNLKTKDFLVSVVTQKMAEVGNEFKDFRREMTKNLDHLIRVLDNGARNSTQLAMRLIEPTIQMLDKTLLKSDMLLFTDMKTEKTLMKASADLATARNLLENGNRIEAQQLVRQVQETIGKLKWQPSADRVQHFVLEGQKQMEFLRMPIERQMREVANQYSLQVNKGITGREVFDFVRSLGMNHESDAAHRLVSMLSSSSASQNAAQNVTQQPFTITNQLAQLTPQQKEVFNTLVFKLTSELQGLLTNNNNLNSVNQQNAPQQNISLPQYSAVNQLLNQLITAVRSNENIQPVLQELQRAISEANQPNLQAKPIFPNEILQKFDQLTRVFERSTWNQFHNTNLHQEQQFNQQNQNLKAALMDLLKNSQQLRDGSQQAAEQTIKQITGQQLLSRFDSQSNMQSMLFSLPVIFKEQIENIKVFVNGKRKSEKIDWENCDLYFLLGTKKIGDTGIQITVANRNLAVTIKNDTPGIKRIFDPFVDRFKEKLDEIGYAVKGIRFAPLTEAKEVEKKSNRIVSNKIGNPETNMPGKGYQPQKGFDLKI